jgi:hypothetical protein
MATNDGWKILSPAEQLLQLVRTVAQLKNDQRQYTKIQGVRLEGRIVAGERRLYAVIDDATASNNGVSYQLAP